MLYSTTTDVLAFLLLGENRVPVESTIFIIDFENLIVSYSCLHPKLHSVTYQME